MCVLLIAEFLGEEQEKEKKRYFENLVGDGARPKQEVKLENPLQEVFLKNMKATLLEFEKYRDDL